MLVTNNVATYPALLGNHRFMSRLNMSDNINKGSHYVFLNITINVWSVMLQFSFVHLDMDRLFGPEIKA